MSSTITFIPGRTYESQNVVEWLKLFDEQELRPLFSLGGR